MLFYYYCIGVMRYTGPKMKLCRREQKNLFWPAKYDMKKNASLPGKSGKAITRLSEYWKLLRNKQVVKRSYQMSEKQFSRLVNQTALKNAKSSSITHDASLYQLLERRFDALLVRSWVAKTIMQSRQMIVHGHRLLNAKKHNVPSYYVKEWDILSLRKAAQNSPLYTGSASSSTQIPFWITWNPVEMTLKLNQMPTSNGKELPADLLKVIEFYARV